MVFDGSDEVLRNVAQPAVDAYMRLGMQPQAGGDPGGGLRRERCVLMCGNEFKTPMTGRMMTKPGRENARNRENLKLVGCFSEVSVY